MIDPSSSEEESDEEQTGRGPPKGGLRQHGGGTPHRTQPHGSTATPKTIIAANNSMSSGMGPSLHSGSNSSGLNRHGSSHSSKHSMAEQQQYHGSGPGTPAHHAAGAGGAGGVQQRENYQQNHQHGMSHAGSDTSGSLDVPSSTVPR